MRAQVVHEQVRRLVRRAGPIHADRDEPRDAVGEAPAFQLALVDRQGHPQLGGAREVHQPARLVVDREFARRRVGGLREEVAERRHAEPVGNGVRRPLAQHALAIVADERDAPTARKQRGLRVRGRSSLHDLDVGEHRCGGRSPSLDVGWPHAIDDEGGTLGSAFDEQRLPGIGGRRRIGPRLVPIPLPGGDLGRGHVVVVLAQMDLVGVDAHMQLGAAVEAGLQAHRQQRNRHGTLEQRHRHVRRAHEHSEIVVEAAPRSCGDEAAELRAERRALAALLALAPQRRGLCFAEALHLVRRRAAPRSQLALPAQPVDLAAGACNLGFGRADAPSKRADVGQVRRRHAVSCARYLSSPLPRSAVPLSSWTKRGSDGRSAGAVSFQWPVFLWRKPGVRTLACPSCLAEGARAAPSPRPSPASGRGRRACDWRSVSAKVRAGRPRRAWEAPGLCDAGGGVHAVHAS